MEDMTWPLEGVKALRESNVQVFEWCKVWAILGKRVSSAGLTLRKRCWRLLPPKLWSRTRTAIFHWGVQNQPIVVFDCGVSLWDWSVSSYHAREQVCEHNLCLHCAAQLLESRGPGVCRFADMFPPFVASKAGPAPHVDSMWWNARQWMPTFFRNIWDKLPLKRSKSAFHELPRPAMHSEAS